MKTQRKARKAATQPPAAAARAEKLIPQHSSSVDAAPATADAPRALSLRLRLIIGAALLFHLAAVVVAALNVPPVSELVARMAEGVRWHTETLLVMPGYRFFAPDPGPADMMRAEIVSADGQRREEDYPDLKRQWPRLLYHRHFMLTSRLSREPDHPMVQAFAKSYARHIATRESAREVSVFRLVHALPTIEQVRTGAILARKTLIKSSSTVPAAPGLRPARRRSRGRTCGSKSTPTGLPC